MHDFVDSPHGYRGHECFPDFYEWVNFLLKRASETPFRWYVKPHPCNADSNPSRKAISLANNRVMAELEERFSKNNLFVSDRVESTNPERWSNCHVHGARDGGSRVCLSWGAGGQLRRQSTHSLQLQHPRKNSRAIRSVASAGADRLQVRIDPRAIEEFCLYALLLSRRALRLPNEPIDERIFALAEWAARMNKTAIFDEFIAAATPDRERGIAEYSTTTLVSLIL